MVENLERKTFLDPELYGEFMKKNAIKSPIALLMSIIEDDRAKDVEKYLSDNHLSTGISFMSKGTAESDIADIFGFGMNDRVVIVAIIPIAQKDRILADINEITGVEKDTYGLNMILNIQSVSSNLLENMNIKL